MEARFLQFIRLLHRSKLPSVTVCGAAVSGGLVLVHWPTFWLAYASQGLAAALLTARDATWADARDAAGRATTGTNADRAAAKLAAEMGVDLGTVRAYSVAGDAVMLLYPQRVPPPVRNLVEAVNEGHDPSRGVYRLRGGIVVVNWVVRATALQIESGHWRLVSGSGVGNALIPVGKRSARLLDGTPWKGAHAATTLVNLGKLQRAVRLLERGRVMRSVPVHRAVVAPADLVGLGGLREDDVARFNADFPDGTEVRIALSDGSARVVLPPSVTCPGGPVHSSHEAHALLRPYSPGKLPVMHAGHEVAWTPRALRALAEAGGAPAHLLRVLAAFVENNRDAPRSMIPPPKVRRDDEPHAAPAKTRWTPAEDALLLRILVDRDGGGKPTSEEWEFLLGRLDPAHRDRARARARLAYLRAMGKITPPV
jgi:hypothetical protein